LCRIQPRGEAPSQAGIAFSYNRSNSITDKKAGAPKWGGLLLVVAAAFLWSLSGFFTQVPQLKVWQPETRGIAIAFWRAIFALCLLLPLARRIRWNRRMIPMACCFAAMNLTFLTAVVIGSPANTIWLQNLAPSWVVLGAIWIYGDRPVFRDWVMLGFCTAGVLFILVMENIPNSGQKTYPWWTSLLGILSGVAYAGVILSIRSMPQEDPAWLIAVNHIVTALMVAPVVFWLGTAIPTGSLWLVLAALGIFQMGLPYFLFAHGLKSTPSHIAALITLLEPILLPIWVHWTRYGDPDYVSPGWWTWVGAGLILLGLITRYVTIRKPVRSVKD
jgi:DME family drug/metabolite transporter